VSEEKPKSPGVAIVTVTLEVPMASDFGDLELTETMESVISHNSGVSFGKFPSRVVKWSAELKRPAP